MASVTNEGKRIIVLEEANQAALRKVSVLQAALFGMVSNYRDYEPTLAEIEGLHELSGEVFVCLADGKLPATR